MSDCKCHENAANVQSSDSVRDLTKLSHTRLLTSENVSREVSSFQNPKLLGAQVSACLSADYKDGQICISFPIVGSICFSVSLPIPDGSTVTVCAETCGFRLKIPPFKGVKATVSFNGQALWTGVIWESC